MTKFNLSGRVLSIVALLFLLAACGSKDLEVTAQFANTQDIDEGRAVYFEGQPIGQVSDIEVQGNGLFIVIELDPSATDRVASNSAIVVNRLKQGAPLEIYNPNNAATDFVQSGQSIRGLDSMFELGAWMVGDAIQFGTSSLTDYVSAFQEYLQSDKFQQDKTNVQQQVATATTDAQQALESLSAELSSAMAELTASEGDAAQALDQLGDELSPVMQEIAKSGTLLMQQLQEFTNSLEQTDQSEQQAGQTFLESLTALMEKLNQSIEQGVEEGVESDSAESYQ